MLENWDADRGRFILYRDEREHRIDAEKHPFDEIPCRIFLDTSVINALVKHPECVFERAPLPTDVDDTLARDLEALMHVFAVGARADWELVASETTMEEVQKTKDPKLRARLLGYVGELWQSHPAEDFSAADFARRLRGTKLLSALPDENDRDLVAHALALECDAFCTRDVATIIRRRHRLCRMSMRVLSPTEWWACIRPWAGLWC